MDSCPDPLEKIFQQVEEESEKRALDDAANAANASAESSVPVEVPGSSSVRPRNRRKGSISITRFGQLSDDSKGSHGPSTSKRMSTIALQSPFFQAHHTNGSTTSFASGGSAHSNEAAHTEDDTHVTQMYHIAGRTSISTAVGGLLPRRLSRARSANYLSAGDANLIIGVSVEEATVESTEDDESSPSRVHAPGAFRSNASTPSMAGSTPARSNWIDKAKEFRQKFRRKSKAGSGADPLTRSSPH